MAAGSSSAVAKSSCESEPSLKSLSVSGGDGSGSCELRAVLLVVMGPAEGVAVELLDAGRCP